VQNQLIGSSRWAAAVASGLVFASTGGLVAGCAASARNHGSENATLAVMRTAHAVREASYEDPAGWSVRYPRTLRLERSSNRYDTVTTEVTIANFTASTGVQQTRHGFRVTPPIAPSGTFPANGIAFRIVSRDNGGARPTSSSALPITLASFRPSREPGITRLPYGGAPYNAGDGETVPQFHYKGVPTSVHREIRTHGHIYEAIGWVGYDASPRLRTQLEQVIASLTFRHVKSGPSPLSGAY
jgi:hypothetical protein